MADKHPYTSGSIGVIQAVAQFRKSFPASITADTLKKLGIAPNNETYLINIMKFIGVLDAENKKTTAATTVFNKHDDVEFQTGFTALVEKAYHELFDLHGPDSWSLPQNKLIGFFRTHDGTSDIVGKRQATTFQTLASLSGKTISSPDQAAAKSAGGPKVAKAPKPAKAVANKMGAKTHSPPEQKPNLEKPGTSPIALTVRVEINLPPGGDQQTYDAIFKSIRENLLNGNGI